MLLTRCLRTVLTPIWAVLLLTAGPAGAQSALTTAVGLGYGSTGYAAEFDGVQGVEIIQGPQMDGEISIGLGPIFALGLEGELTIAETGVRVDGLEEYDIAETTNIMNRGDAERISGAMYSVGTFLGLHFGDFRPSVGAGYMTMEVNEANGRLIRRAQCPIWMAKPLDYDFIGSFNVALEYEQTFGDCDIEASSLSFAAKVKF